jgi:FtsP/CotA-like multicopper oxidase with cupredoxin domain
VRSLRLGLVGISIALLSTLSTCAQKRAQQVCPRPAEGSEVSQPKDLRSQDGLLRVEFAYRSVRDDAGRLRFCYVDGAGNQAPTLRVRPGDWLILGLKNEAVILPTGGTRAAVAANDPAGSLVVEKISSAPGTHRQHNDALNTTPCTNGAMQANSTNLHFHGLTVPSICHQDEVLHTLIQPGDPPFEYRFQIPPDEQPGLYWYHPHIHGSTKAQVLGGASGVLIIEGIERATPEVQGLPERVLVIRDEELLHPNAAPAANGTSFPPVVLDADGDVMNTGTGTGKPAEDLSINFVSVPYPEYPPAVITMKPGERQLWRVLNASAITYVNLQLLFAGQAQAVGVVALDGVPVDANGDAKNHVLWQNHLGIPPGGRIEFVVQGPAEGTQASLVTRSVNTGAVGENDPTRPLATIVAKQGALEPPSKLPPSAGPLPSSQLSWIGNTNPVRVRKLYFSERPQDPHDPQSPTAFFLTVDGESPKVFDPSSAVVNIVAHQGEVEDWIIENRTQEVHAFHIHQVHFLLLEWFGLPVNEPFLRDTINVPFWDRETAVYPRVKLRMDFRDPNAVGVFPYHCHLLEHEDGGMMGLVRVEPAKQAGKP